MPLHIPIMLAQGGEGTGGGATGYVPPATMQSIVPPVAFASITIAIIAVALLVLVFYLVPRLSFRFTRKLARRVTQAVK